ncbi:MAG TPA: winged helix DNA-binding domain-containing protein [Dermatophilaceae bacterium]|nr:winged helix DNA-binding domain-containing protein [Dermatophilaceae bacterium]
MGEVARPARPAELARLRVAAQRLVATDLASAADAVSWLTCVQAQDYPGAVLSLALRTMRRTRADVLAALDAGAVVRSWPMRGTLHFVPARDLSWMLSLTSARMLAASASRRAGLGIDDAMVRRARDLALRRLGGSRRLSRDELFAEWDAHGLIQGVPQRAVHLLGQLAQTGVLCWGPSRGGSQSLVLLEEWVPDPRRLDRGQALGEWARRYFRSHGPATVRDFAWWTGLTLTDARAGLALAAPELLRIQSGGVDLFLDPATPQRLHEHASEVDDVLLLPGFDELLLGYQDRSATLDPAHRQHVVPGNNGMFMPTVVRAGRVVGTWRRPRAGQTVDATPFTSFPVRVRTAVANRYAALP